ncbi:hypothetical protein K466DRAFT_284113 [Polyporus arcularius HHB13444]|uniref:Uncharacterized protein n=1 Tax=Polyporus arcularius HHB13444 TaxID=1314778 RepID=A0A5C3P1Y2_9APHY|nr:hypothetical protein K466DRAFT_284113 [Polyporus arcularius HHB13444]
MLEDLLLLCKQSIGTSFAFHRPADSRVAYPGRYVHTSGQWTWEPLFDDWDDYLKGRVQVPPIPALEGLRSEYTAPELMQVLRLMVAPSPSRGRWRKPRE